MGTRLSRTVRVGRRANSRGECCYAMLCLSVGPHAEIDICDESVLTSWCLQERDEYDDTGPVTSVRDLIRAAGVFCLLRKGASCRAGQGAGLMEIPPGWNRASR